MTENDPLLSIGEARLFIKNHYGKEYSRTAVFRWINRGRRGLDGQVRRLKSYQFGYQSPHEIRKSDLMAYVNWLMQPSPD